MSGARCRAFCAAQKLSNRKKKGRPNRGGLFALLSCRLLLQLVLQSLYLEHQRLVDIETYGAL